MRPLGIARVCRKAVLTAAVLLGSAAVLHAQSHEEDPRYGKNPDERLENVERMRLLRESADRGDYDAAAVYVGQLMDGAPAASPNLYILGATVYKNKIAHASDSLSRRVYLDSLLLIYDRRAEYFGGDAQRGLSHILQMKARDYRALAPDDREGVMRCFREAAGAGPVTAGFARQYMAELVGGYSRGEVTAAELLEEYERLLPSALSGEKEQAEAFEALFASAGAMDAASLEAFYGPLLAGRPDDAGLLERACEMMSAARSDSDVFLAAAEKNYRADPSAETALRLAAALQSRGMHARALEYLYAAAAGKGGASAAAELNVLIAVSELAENNPRAAARAARTAISLSPSDGNARMLLAEAYIAGAAKENCGRFQAATVYWLAWDELQKARDAFAGNRAKQQAVEARMAWCAANFPTYEEGFMNVRDYQDGDKYTVECGWIAGETTIRSR